jgi:hypothetical protein
MKKSFELKPFYRLLSTVLFCLPVLAALPAGAEDVEHRLSQGVTMAMGSGLEVTHGDYGSNADATVVTMPLLVALYPYQDIDLTLELPLVYLTSRSASGVVITQSGGMGRRRSSASSTITTTTTSSEAGLGDINLSAGWTVLQDSDVTPRVRPTVYLKAPTGDDGTGLGTGTFEGGLGLSLSKWLGDVQLFADGAYILQDSTSDYQGKNYVSYTAGAGVQATDRLFVSLFAKGASARVEGGEAPFEARLKFNFLQSRRVAWELYGLAGFTDASPTAGGGVLMMYQF